MKQLIAILLAVQILTAPPPLGAAVIDGVVAVAGDRVITVGEVLTESRIMEISSAPAGSVTTLPGGTFSQEVLEQLINRELLYREARRFDISGREEEILGELLEFEQRFAAPETFSRFLSREGITLDDLLTRFMINRVVRGFMAEKIALMTYVGEKEVAAYYEERRDLYGASTLPAVREEIRARLRDRRGAQYLEKWITELKERGKVSYLPLPALEPHP